MKGIGKKEVTLWNIFVRPSLNALIDIESNQIIFLKETTKLTSLTDRSSNKCSMDRT